MRARHGSPRCRCSTGALRNCASVTVRRGPAPRVAVAASKETIVASLMVPARSSGWLAELADRNDIGFGRSHLNSSLCAKIRTLDRFVGHQRRGAPRRADLARRQHVAPIGQLERRVDVSVPRGGSSAHRACDARRALRKSRPSRSEPDPSTARQGRSRRGLDINARPIASICCCPPESEPAACRGALRKHRKERKHHRRSRRPPHDRGGYEPGAGCRARSRDRTPGAPPAPARPRRRPACARRRASSRGPPARLRPDLAGLDAGRSSSSGWSCPPRFAPTIATISPAPTSSETPRRASIRPYAAVRILHHEHYASAPR